MVTLFLEKPVYYISQVFNNLFECCHLIILVAAFMLCCNVHCTVLSSIKLLQTAKSNSEPQTIQNSTSCLEISWQTVVHYLLYYVGTQSNMIWYSEMAWLLFVLWPSKFTCIAAYEILERVLFCQHNPCFLISSWLLVVSIRQLSLKN